MLLPGAVCNLMVAPLLQVKEAHGLLLMCGQFFHAFFQGLQLHFPLPGSLWMRIGRQMHKPLLV